MRLNDEGIDNILSDQLKQLRKESESLHMYDNDDFYTLANLSKAMADVAIAIKTNNTSSGLSRQDTEEISKIISEKVNQLSMKTLSKLHLEDE